MILSLYFINQRHLTDFSWIIFTTRKICACIREMVKMGYNWFEPGTVGLTQFFLSSQKETLPSILAVQQSIYVTHFEILLLLFFPLVFGMEREESHINRHKHILTCCDLWTFTLYFESFVFKKNDNIWVFLKLGHEFDQTPGVGNGQGGLECCSPWGLKESDTTERLNWTELMQNSFI